MEFILSPVQIVDHGAAGEAASNAGPRQCRGGRRLAQVVPHGPQSVHVAAAGAQAPRQAAHTALTDAGIVSGVSHWCGVCGKRERERERNEFQNHTGPKGQQVLIQLTSLSYGEKKAANMKKTVVCLHVGLIYVYLFGQ